MRVFSLPNSSSSRVIQIDLVDPPAVTRPKFGSKDEYRAWCQNPTTDHSFLSFSEGVSPAVRVSSVNPVCKLHGLIGEYDAVQEADGWAWFAPKTEFKPVWGVTTFSGHRRLYWPFEKPIDCSHAALTKQFVKIAWSEIGPKGLMPGFRMEESSDLTHYYEIGTPWVKFGPSPIPVDTLLGWFHRAVKKVQWKRESDHVPFDRVRKEAERRFPGRWPGGWDLFSPGARGVRFWDDSADAASVIVAEAGCVCFTGEDQWVPWSRIFGADFARKTNDTIIGKALDGIWLEPGLNRFWLRRPSQYFEPIAREDLKTHLIASGVSRVKPKDDDLSPLEHAMHTITLERTISGVYPAFHRSTEVVEINGGKYLNISRVKPFAAAEETIDTWGDQFPWISDYLTQLFGLEDPNQLSYFLAWVSHFYKSILAGRPQRGLAVFLSGPSDAGKTFLSTKLLGTLFGGAEDASSFLTGVDMFNGRLVGCPLWCIDDATIASDQKARNRYSQIVKSCVANDRLNFRAMHREGITLEWCGRIIVTLNDDAESLLMLPNTDLSLSTKIMLFRASATTVKFAGADIEGELPYFAAYLRDLPEQPPFWVGGRFGVAPYHNVGLKRSAEAAQDSAVACDVIGIWRKAYFAENPSKSSWSGTPAELLQAMFESVAYRDIATSTFRSTTQLGSQLKKLVAKDIPWLKTSEAEREGTVAFIYSISAPTFGS